MNEPKMICLSEEEARAVRLMIRTNWPPLNIQKLIFNLVNRIEKELGIE